MMPRKFLWLIAAGAVVTTALLGEAWRGEPGEPAILVQAAKATASSSAAPAPSPPVDAATPHTAAPASMPPPTVAMPSFDIALIGPDGRGVIAGRAQPGAKVVLLGGDKELAQDRADANGEWIIVVENPPLSAGPHELRVIQLVEGHAPVTSDQVIVAIVPDQKQSGPEKNTLVMIAPPAGAATLVQPPSAAGVPKSGDLLMSTLDYDEGGHVTVTGKASPGAVVQVYINDQMVAEGQAAADGSWRLVPAKPLEPGKYQLRLDRLAKDGKPVARLELSFERVFLPAATGNYERLVVVRGDSLWNIARARYGDGFRHTLIYGANKNQIRDPDLIYPGQVFSLPTGK
jgi:hypothetical protein